MVKRIFLVFSMTVFSGFGFANGLNAINDPVMNPCIQRPYLAGCSGNNQSGGQPRQVINIPNRWGVIYYNPANDAVGYAENNTEGYKSARREALEMCIRSGGGKNPSHRDGQGCRSVTEYRNQCGAIAVSNESYAAKNDIYLEKAEQKALEGCGKYSNSCRIFYSGCSRHPDYRY